MSGNRRVKTCPIAEWFVNWMVCRHLWTIRLFSYQTFSLLFKPPFGYRTKSLVTERSLTIHSVNQPVKFDVSGNRRRAVNRMPTVLLNCLCQKITNSKILLSQNSRWYFLLRFFWWSTSMHSSCQSSRFSINVCFSRSKYLYTTIQPFGLAQNKSTLFYLDFLPACQNARKTIKTKFVKKSPLPRHKEFELQKPFSSNFWLI